MPVNVTHNFRWLTGGAKFELPDSVARRCSFESCLLSLDVIWVAMSEIKSWSFWRAVLAEFLGMIIFIFMGLSAAVGDPNDFNLDREITVAFAFGLAIATLAECIGHISGAHLNPAVTLGLVTSCRISILRALFYMLAQMLGAVVGSAIVYGIRAEHVDSLGVNEVRWSPWFS